jgi:hypothetical protein
VPLAFRRGKAGALLLNSEVRPILKRIGSGGLIRLVARSQSRFRARRSVLSRLPSHSKSPHHVERHVFLDHMVAGSGQLVGHRLERDDPLGPGLLALIVIPNQRVEPNAEGTEKGSEAIFNKGGKRRACVSAFSAYSGVGMKHSAFSDQFSAARRVVSLPQWTRRPISVVSVTSCSNAFLLLLHLRQSHDLRTGTLILSRRFPTCSWCTRRLE